MQQVSSSELTLLVDGKPQMFSVNSQTRVVLVGQVGLAVGSRVQVKYLENTVRTEKVARGIRVLRTVPDPSPSAQAGQSAPK